MQIFKAFCTAQIASIVDFVSAVLLSSVLGVYYVVATTIGAVLGGVVNCTMNYKWVFPVSDSRKCFIAVKFFLVWSGSILFNTWGTYILTEWMKEQAWVIRLLGEYHDQIYIVSKVLVALVVAVCWNYLMQRFFVYRNLHICGDRKENTNHIE